MVNLIWLKRDLRLRDHAPLWMASQNGAPVMLVYAEDPLIWSDPHYSERHRTFVYQSLLDLESQLEPVDASVGIYRGAMQTLLERIHNSIGIAGLYSYQQIGLDVTYERDKRIAAWCKAHSVSWHELPYGAVYRGLTHRKDWTHRWNKRILVPTHDIDLEAVNWAKPPHCQSAHQLSIEAHDPNLLQRQPGGERRAWQVLKHFLSERGKNYHKHISSPGLSRKACSRLSPYLAWGNVSVKQVYSIIKDKKQHHGWSRPITAITSRLHWHCHFIQKFESESNMEFRPVNKAYLHFPYETGPEAQRRFYAWKTGKTGIPLIDACMRALNTTGYLNFRMRAQLVSFATHILNVHWKMVAEHLANVFLDFEPGIHYPQIQMQAGVTGTNTIRLYNPIKQSFDNDPEAEFIHKWIPELASIPAPLVFQPWLLTPIDLAMTEVDELDYPVPVINLEESLKQARDRIWTFRDKPEVIKEAKRILARHTTPNSPSRQQARPRYRS